MARRLKRMSAGRLATIGVPYLWLFAFFLFPFLIVLKIAFSEFEYGQPPYAPTWDTWEGVEAYFSQLSFYNFELLFGDWLYFGSYLTSLRIAAISTFVTLLIGYPIAYGIVRARPAWRSTLLILVILPFWTSFLIRVYAWIGILKNDGLLNLALLNLGIISEPLVIQYTEVAVHIGIVYSYLPFMILPLYAALEKLDPMLLEASADLGCRPARSFWRITFPLSLPGVAAGCFLVFIPAVGEFVIPELLGGSNIQMIGRTLWDEFFKNNDWPVASAVAVILLIVLVIPIMIFQRAANRSGAG